MLNILSKNNFLPKLFGFLIEPAGNFHKRVGVSCLRAEYEVRDNSQILHKSYRSPGKIVRAGAGRVQGEFYYKVGAGG